MCGPVAPPGGPPVLTARILRLPRAARSWECLYKWLNMHRDDPQCPVCKAGIEMPGRDPSKAKVVPLYVGEENSDPR